MMNVKYFTFSENYGLFNLNGVQTFSDFTNLEKISSS